MITGVIRGIIDNINLSANVMFAFKPEYLAQNEDGKMYPGKGIELSADCDDVRKASFSSLFSSPWRATWCNYIKLWTRWAKRTPTFRSS